MVARQVTVYETQTPDGWDGTGVLTTLDGATVTQVVQQTVTATEGGEVTTPSTVSSGTLPLDTTTIPTATSATPTLAIPSSLRSSSGPASSQSPSTAQISTGSIVGIAVGSIAALVLLITCLLFAFGFRLRRSKRRSETEVFECKENQDAPARTPDAQDGKAELEDAAYTRALEKLHDGAKPELEASKPRRAGWGAFFLKSLKQGSGLNVAELDAGTVIRGVHELPA